MAHYVSTQGGFDGALQAYKAWAIHMLMRHQRILKSTLTIDLHISFIGVMTIA